MTKPIREFSANEGDYSIGLAGPDAIEQDIDTIMRMFDPLTTHEDGSPGGIGPDNMKSGSVTDTVIGDRTVDQAIVDAYSNTGTLTKLFSWIAKTLKTLKGTTNWYDAPSDTINNIHTRVSTNSANIELGVTALNTHKTSADHDARYYTETELNNGALDARYYTETELNAGQLNTLYYTKAQLEGFLGGGDTNIIEEVFMIINQDNLDGTFTYNDGTQDIIGTISPEGYLVFVLQEGDYVLGENRIECIIDHSLRKSVASGGLIEISETEIATTSTYKSGTELTFRYYQRIAVAAEYNIKLNTLKPPLNSGRNMWFEETSEIAGVKNVTIRPEIDNDYLKEIHPKTNAGQVTETSTKKIMTSEERDKLNGIQAGAQVNTVNSVAGRTGVVVLNKADVGLDNVANYAVASDAEAEAMTADDKYMTPIKTKLTALKAIGELFPVTASYMTFCSEGYGSTANPGALDAALGKNNEDMILQIGRQLAMYAWFKGVNKTSYPFTNLKEIGRASCRERV